MNSCIIYITCSGKRIDISANEQLKACKEYAQNNNLLIKAIYRDSDKSGISIEDKSCLNNAINSLVPGDTFLLHRLCITNIFTVRELRTRVTKKGANIVFIVDVDAMHIYNWALRIVELFSETNNIPYGFTEDSTEGIKVDEREQEIINIIFNMHNNDLSYKEIADFLNQNIDKYPPRKWLPSTIEKIIDED